MTVVHSRKSLLDEARAILSLALETNDCKCKDQVLNDYCSHPNYQKVELSQKPTINRRISVAFFYYPHPQTVQQPSSLGVMSNQSNLFHAQNFETD
jgi:hypothetical protein